MDNELCTVLNNRGSTVLLLIARYKSTNRVPFKLPYQGQRLSLHRAKWLIPVSVA